jgi:hypothetical protein
MGTKDRVDLHCAILQLICLAEQTPTFPRSQVPNTWQGYSVKIARFPILNGLVRLSFPPHLARRTCHCCRLCHRLNIETWVIANNNEWRAWIPHGEIQEEQEHISRVAVIQAEFYSRYGFHSEGWALEAAAAECAALPRIPLVVCVLATACEMYDDLKAQGRQCPEPSRELSP